MQKRLLCGSLIAFSLCAGISAAQADWQDMASANDVKRLASLEESKARGLSAAQSGPDAALIHAVLDASPVSASQNTLTGSWRCRTIKLGGMTPDVVYSWFRCRIGERDGGLFFEKISGTQRLSGNLYPHESGGYVLLGALSAKGEPVHRYSGSGPSAGAQATPDDVIGLLSSTGPSTARLELPWPMQESVFDVIEMKR